jgi:glutaconate CoA-transferase subunit B
VTSPGYLTGGDARRRAGLDRGAPAAVVTDLAVLGFDPRSKLMRLDGLQPGATVEDVVANTGFELLMAPHVEAVPPPTVEELAALDRLRHGETHTPERVVAG